MRSTFGIVSLLVALVLGAGLFAMNARHSGPTSQTATQAEAQAQAEAATANFSQAAIELQAYQAQNGTFVGASLPPAYGVTLASTTATAYCLQAGTGASVQHEVGPGGTPQPGPCA